MLFISSELKVLKEKKATKVASKSKRKRFTCEQKQWKNGKLMSRISRDLYAKNCCRSIMRTVNIFFFSFSTLTNMRHFQLIIHVLHLKFKKICRVAPMKNQCSCSRLGKRAPRHSHIHTDGNNAEENKTRAITEQSVISVRN